MKKILLLIAIFLLVGCSNNKAFYLTDKYYNKGDFIEVNEEDINYDESFVLYTHNSYCALPIHCETIFKGVMEKYKIDFLSMTFEDFKETDFYKKVKYAPSIIIVKNGEIITYLDANSNDDLEKYQDVIKFEEWIQKYIFLEKTTN